MRYIDQWNRLKNWYARLEEFKVDQDLRPGEDPSDFVHAFFINCLILKDWIRNSDVNANVKKSVEKAFDDQEGVECFSVCAGLANGSKHLLPDRHRRPIHGTASIVGQSITVNLYPSHKKGDRTMFARTDNKARYAWTVESGGSKYDAYDLAKECMDAWEQFFNQHSLPTRNNTH